MDKTSHSRFIDDHLGRHPSQLEQVHFLPIQFEHTGFRVRQANKGQIVLAEIGLKCFGAFRPHHDHLGLPFFKF